MFCNFFYSVLWLATVYRNLVVCPLVQWLVRPDSSLSWWTAWLSTGDKMTGDGVWGKWTGEFMYNSVKGNSGKEGRNNVLKTHVQYVQFRRFNLLLQRANSLKSRKSFAKLERRTWQKSHRLMVRWIDISKKWAERRMTVSKCDYTEEKTKIHIVILMKRDITRDQFSELQSRHVR